MDSLRTKKFAYSFIIIFILANFLWNIVFQHKQVLLDWGGITFQIIACCASIGWIASTFFKHKGRVKIFWLFLGLGVLSYLIGTVIWSYNEFILKPSGGLDRMAEKLWIGQNIFYIMAFFMLMKEIKSNLLTIRFFFDIFIAMSAAATLSWIFLINPLLDHDATITFHIIELLYPILDLSVFVGILSIFIGTNSIFPKQTTFFLVSGMLTQIIADTIFSYLKAMNVYTVGSINEPFWILSVLLIGLSGMYHDPNLPKESRKNNKRKESLFFKYSIPYLGVVFLSIYVISLLYKTHPVVMGLFLSILLLILRQIFTLLENDKLVNDLNNLNEGLEMKVKERTDKLVETLNSMEYLAYHDAVTELPNRRYMEKRLSQAISATHSRHKRIFLMLLDLDRFKHINDSLGHSYGDLLLKEVGVRLVDCLNPNEVVCRIGGDEFVVLMEDKNVQEMEKTASTILEALRETYHIQGFELHITPSIGVSIFPDHGRDLDSLLMKADTAMYKVKENGKNHYKIYDGAMSMESIAELESSLRKALERNEFILHYQPQLSLHTNTMVGVEALLRWKRPDGGFVPPSDFIPFAEETGLILPIGERVLREACRQSVSWKEKGFSDLRMAVNISSLQFQHDKFIDMVSTIIEETGANPNNIELEITESVAMGPMEKTLGG